MSRLPTLEAADVRRIRRDRRFRAALAAHADTGPVGGWRTQGHCLQADPEIFFPYPAQDPAPALAVCASCPVQGPCLAVALDAGSDGVWGGTVPDERRRMRAVWVDVAG